eukprot:UN15796
MDIIPLKIIQVITHFPNQSIHIDQIY